MDYVGGYKLYNNNKIDDKCPFSYRIPDPQMLTGLTNQKTKDPHPQLQTSPRQSLI